MRFVDFDGFHLSDDFSRLHAVCPDILYGCRSDMPGDVGQVFHSPVSLRHRPCHEGVPVLSGSDPYSGAFGVFPDDFDAFHGGVKDRPFKVIREEEIAASSQYQYFVRVPFVLPDEIQQFLLFFRLHEVFTLRVDAECVVWL